jgi:phosphoribosylaminoimidazole-succinocarboxamide synthase
LLIREPEFALVLFFHDLDDVRHVRLPLRRPCQNPVEDFFDLISRHSLNVAYLPCSENGRAPVTPRPESGYLFGPTPSLLRPTVAMDILTDTSFDFLGPVKRGKVRDIYDLGNRLVLITTDRHSSFDRIIAHIPGKGQVLNQVSAWWFENTKDIVPNHVLATPDPNVTIAKKCALVPIEAVVRGYLTGVTDTAIWTRYAKGHRDFGGVVLPDDMRKNHKLPQPIFDPTTKEELHDRALSSDELIAEGFITAALLERVSATALALFARGQDIAARNGLILVDTKYEFGLGADGALVVIDEIHTPDSSRYWQRDSYEARIASGEEPQNFDKEFLRLWFIEHSDPYRDSNLPAAPPELVQELSRRYIAMYEQITSTQFNYGATPILPRIEKNLKAFGL